MTESGAPSRRALEQAVARFFHMCNTHCPANLTPLLTADVELLTSTDTHGYDGVHAYLVSLWERYPCMTYLVENLLVDGSAAAAEVSYSGGPDGAGASCFLFQFRGEKIRRIRVY